MINNNLLISPTVVAIRFTQDSFGLKESPLRLLPLEILKKIIYLSQPSRLPESCQIFYVDAIKSMINRLKHCLKLADAFNDQISQLSEGKSSLFRSEIAFAKDDRSVAYLPFRFDRINWGEKIIALQQERVPFPKIQSLYKECRLDLVEALSEFNLDPDWYETSACRVGYRPSPKQVNRLIDMLNLPDFFVPKELSGVLDEARHTVKGDLFFVDNVPWLKSDMDSGMRNMSLAPVDSPVTENGPFLKIRLINNECDNWSEHSYQRFSRDTFWHYAFFVGKEEGDRIVFPPANDKEQIILRLNQLRYRYNYHPINIMLVKLIDSMKDSAYKLNALQDIQLQKISSIKISSINNETNGCILH